MFQLPPFAPPTPDVKAALVELGKRGGLLDTGDELTLLESRVCMARPDLHETATLVAAVDLALGGDWQAAHQIAQDHQGDELADWIHAVAHRMEGDVGNARYWYARCGQRLRDGVSVAAELAEIRAALAAAQGR